jgi:hypothetical protein
VNAFVDATVAATKTGTVVDASGGLMTVPGGGTMTIPAGALVGPTTLEVRISTTSRADGPTPLSPMSEFLPDGLLFARPVTVTLPSQRAPRLLRPSSSPLKRTTGSSVRRPGGFPLPVPSRQRCA